MTYRNLLVGFATLSLILAACGTGGADETTTSGTPTSTTASVVTTTTEEGPATTGVPSTTTVESTTTIVGGEGQVVYFLLEELAPDAAGPFLVPVYRETNGSVDPSVTVELLLAGPTLDEVEGIPSISTGIPDATLVLGVDIVDGVATVDLSEEFDDGGGSFSMFARLAQVVYTVTRLPEVDEVAFGLEGEPVTVFSSEGIELDGPQRREHYYDLLPPIFVDSPAWGEPVVSPIQVRGLSNVFEAVSQVMLTDDDGLPLFEGTVTATCGTGCWGEWETEIPYTLDRNQFGALIVWEFSAEDGGRIHVREYPVQLR